MSYQYSDFPMNVHLDLSDSINYYITEKKGSRLLSKAKIDHKVNKFPNVKDASGTTITCAAQFDGIVGQNFFKWIDGAQNAQDIKAPYFTSRVVGFIKDLSAAYQAKSLKVTFSGKNIQYLDVPTLVKAGIKFKVDGSASISPVTSTQKVTRSLPNGVFTGPLGGIYNRNYLEAMNAGQPNKILTEKDIEAKGDRDRWFQMEYNYNAFCNRLLAAKATNQHQYQIPEKAHLIWLGSQPGKDVLEVKESWKKHHPGWEVKLWNDADAEALIEEVSKEFPSIKTVWDAAIQNAHKNSVYAEKADILRLCILWKHGGVYVDADLPCFGKVDDLHCYSNFYIAMEQNDHAVIYTGNALIGAQAGHSIIRRAIENLKPRKKDEDTKDLLGRTGPGLLTDQAYYFLEQDEKNGTTNTLVLPPSYFYPYHSGLNWILTSGKVHDEFKRKIAKDSVTPWSKGLHLWNMSWM